MSAKPKISNKAVKANVKSKQTAMSNEEFNKTFADEIEADKAAEREAKAKESERKAMAKIEARKQQAARREEDAKRAQAVKEAKEKAKQEKLAARKAKQEERERLRAERLANRVPRRFTDEMLQKKYPHYVPGSVRFETEGKWEGKQTAEIRTKGANGHYDGNTLRCATSDIFQTFHTPEVLLQLRRERSRAARAARAKSKAKA